MKSILWLHYIVIIIGLAMGLQSFSVQSKELIACGHPYYPPVSWVQNKKLVGLAPAVVKIIFAELGYQVKLDKVGNWKRCLSEVKTGHADIVVAAYKIVSRESYFHFSEQYIVADPIGVYVNPRRNKTYHSLNVLKGKTAGLLFGDSFGDRLDKFMDDNNRIEYVSEGQQNFKKLSQGRIDFMPLGILTGQLQTEKFGYSKQIIVAPFKLETEYYYLALSRHSKLSHHFPYINKRLNELHENGQIQTLVTKYSQIYLESSAEGDLP
jgi:polar amino acid transport system substrate-binding protein